MRDVILKLRRGSLTSSRIWHQRISLTQSVLFCLSTGDFFSAFFVQFMSTWMVPSFIEVSLANGSVTSCTLQGFFGYLFYGLSVCSNASLAVAYSMFVQFNWKDENKDRYRLPFTIIPILCALVLAIAPLPGQNYNYNGGFFCDITAHPLGCDYPDSDEICTRGVEARYMLLYVGVIPFMIAFAIIVVAVLLLIYSVLQQERRMDRYSRQGMPLHRSMTTKTTRQGIYYILAFGVTWVPWYVYALIEYKQGKIPKALAIVHYITQPLQGVFNTLVYFRPKYKARRASNPQESRTNSVLHMLKISLPAAKCFTWNRRNGSNENHNSNEKKKATCPIVNGADKHDEKREEDELDAEEQQVKKKDAPKSVHFSADTIQSAPDTLQNQ